MAIYYNPNTYDIGVAAPIDSRFTKQTNVDRDAIPTPVRYEGLQVYVLDPAGNGSIPGTLYILSGGILNTNWTTPSLLGGLWSIVGGIITNVGTTDVAITTSLIVPKLKPSVDGVTAIQLTTANGNTVIVNLDTTSGRVGINNIAPAYDLDVTGSMRATGTVYGSALQGDSLIPYSAGSFLTISTKPGALQAIVFNSVGSTPTETMRLTTDGRLGFGVTVPTAQIHIAAGSTIANTAPIKLNSGSLLLTPEVGAIEFLTDAYYATITTGAARKQFAFREATLGGYGITDAVLKTGDTMTGALQIGVVADNKLILQHNYTTSPAGASYIKWMDEASALLGTVGLAPTTKALTLTSNAPSPLIVLNSNTLAINGIQIGNATTTITKDGSNNIVFTDVVTGSKTLAQLLAADLWTASLLDITNANSGNVGIGALPTAGYKLDVAGNFRYTGKISSVVSGSAAIDIEAKSSSGYKLRFFDVTNSLNLLHINQLGYVGINTNAQVDQFAVVANTTAIYAGNITNSNITGKGLYVGGASGTDPSLLVADYQGNTLFTVTPTNIVGTKPISASNLSGTNTGDQTFTSGGSIGIGFYLDDTNIIPSGTQNANEINTLSKIPIATFEVIDNIPSNNTTTIGESYLYDFALGRTVIDAGVWNFNFYCAVDTAAGVSTLTMKVSKVVVGSGTVTSTGVGTTRTMTASTGTPFAVANIDFGGTIVGDSYLQTTTGLFRILSRVSDQVITVSTLTTYTNQTSVVYNVWKFLFTTTTPQINALYAGGTGLTLVTSSEVTPVIPINITDKFGVTLYANTTSNRIVYYSHNGSARYTNFQTPLITLHNNLAGLQGGAAPNEFYHLTAAEHTGIVYNNATPTAVTIGGIPSGSTFTNQTLQQMFDKLLYPFQVPAFTSFAITGQTQTLECGLFVTSGVKTFTWTTSNSANVGVNTISLTDNTTSTLLAGSLANSGTSAQNIGAAITNLVTATPHSWRINGTDTRPVAMTPALFVVTWYSPFYYGVGATGLSVASVQALTKVVGPTGNFTRTFNPTSQKMYYAYPASYGNLTLIKDPNGFDITADWTKTVVNFTTNSPNYEGGTVSYNVYEYNNLTTQTSFNVTFNF